MSKLGIHIVSKYQLSWIKNVRVISMHSNQ